MRTGFFPSSNGVLESAYRTFDRLNTRERRLTESSIASLHLLGERVSAAVFSYVLNERGKGAELIDFVDDDFPIAVTGDYLNARVNVKESKARVQFLSERNNGEILVIPGYGGIDPSSRRLKALGRGGSDTSASYIFYLIRGDNFWILTDTYGILESNFPGAKTIKNLHVEEAMDAASLGAKLPGRRAVIPLKRYFENNDPNIYIAHSQDVTGPKTKIVRQKTYTPLVQLVAGREATLHEINGDVKGLQNVLDGNGLDWVGQFTDDYARIVFSAETSEYGTSLVRNFIARSNYEGRFLGRENECAFVGVVGLGLLRTGATQELSSILSKSGVNIWYNMDPGPVSIGYLISINDLKKSVEALYENLLEK